MRPARSEKRPAIGLTTASTAALRRNTSPIVGARNAQVVESQRHEHLDHAS